MRSEWIIYSYYSHSRAFFPGALVRDTPGCFPVSPPRERPPTKIDGGVGGVGLILK